MTIRPTHAPLLALTALFAVACSEPPPPPEPVVRPVLSEIVGTAESARAATFAGTAQAGVESRLSFRVNGTIDAVLVEIGDTVRRGQTLARLDPVDYELSLEEAMASLAQLEAAERQALADYDRVRALYENNNASKSELDAARAASDSSRAQVSAGRQRVEQARRQVSYTRLAAPRDGTIANVAIEVNESASAGREAFLLTSGSHPEVRAAVPEVFIAQIGDGNRATVHFDAIPDQSFLATVREVGVAAIGSATYDVTVQIDGPAPGVRSGMAAEVTFHIPNLTATGVLVPPVAVGEDQDGRFVYVIESAGELGTARRRTVEVGQLTPAGLQIVSGLKQGERVATAGVRRLADGMPVRVQPAGAAG